MACLVHDALNLTLVEFAATDIVLAGLALPTGVAIAQARGTQGAWIAFAVLGQPGLAVAWVPTPLAPCTHSLSGAHTIRQMLMHPLDASGHQVKTGRRCGRRCDTMLHLLTP